MRRKSQGSFPTGLEMDLNACQSSPQPGLYQQSSNPRKVSRLWDGWTERGWSWRSFLKKQHRSEQLLQEHYRESEHRLKQISFEWCSKFCWVPLQFLSVTHSASLAPRSGSEAKPSWFQELPIKHQGVSLVGRSQAFHSIPELPDKLRRILFRARRRAESRNSSSHISDWFLVQGGCVPTGTSPAMAFISSDPHSHPHNGNKNKNPPLITQPVQYYECTLMHKMTTFEKN